MNSLERKRDGKGIISKGWIFEKDPIFGRNAKRLCIKFVAAVILLPCFIEFAFAEPGKVMAKNFGRSSVVVICIEKERTNIKPNIGGILELGEFVGERIVEDRRCDSEASYLVVPIGYVASKSGGKNAASDQPEVFKKELRHFFIGSLFGGL